MSTKNNEYDSYVQSVKKFGNTVVRYSEWLKLGTSGIKKIFSDAGLEVSIRVIDDKVADGKYEGAPESKWYFPPTVLVKRV